MWDVSVNKSSIDTLDRVNIWNMSLSKLIRHDGGFNKLQ